MLKRAVFLDYRSVDPGDLDRSRLQRVIPEWAWHESTAPGEVTDRIREAEVVLSNKVVLNRQALEAAPRLKLICIAATGTDKIDLPAARDLGIQVSNVTGYATPAVVQHVFALLLALTTSLPAYQADVQAGSWQAQTHFCMLDHPISELAGKTLGIVGYGELGRAVAQVAESFGMRVLVAQRRGSSGQQPGRVTLDELLAQSDVVSLHVPLAGNTRNLIGERELALMQPHALLINTARGGLVEEQPLANALREGRLGGAGVDVLTVEPPRDGNPLLAADIPNLIVTPHTAWASREARQRLLDEIGLNIQAFQQGEDRNRVA